MSEIILEKRYPHSRSEDIIDAFMRGYAKGKTDRPQGEWKSVKASIYPYGCDVECSICGHRMMDLIERQAAIDAVHEDLDGCRNWNASGTETANEVEMVLDCLPSAQTWIPVTERLPEEKINRNTHDFGEVLCTTTFGDVRVYKFGKPIGWEEPHFWNGAGNMDKYVTAWMPLPEPYKEAER